MGHFILSRDFLIAGIGVKSKALVMSREENQNSFWLELVACKAEFTIVRGSMVL